MTDDEASKVAGIVAQADGGCSVCIRALTKDLVAAFPEVDWPTKVSAAFGSEIRIDDY